MTARYSAGGSKFPRCVWEGTKLDVELAITPYQVNGKAIFTAYVRDISERVRSEARRAAQYAIATLNLSSRRR